MNKPRNNPKDLEERAKEAAGNWKWFESFGWHDRPEDEDNCRWTLDSNPPIGKMKTLPFVSWIELPTSPDSPVR